MAKKSSAGLVLGLGALLAFAFASSSSSSSAAPKPASGSGGAPIPPMPPAPVPVPPVAPVPAPTPNSPCVFDANLPADLQQQATTAFNSDLSPYDYDDIATTFQNGGYPKTAACALAKKQQVNNIIATQGGMPFVIRQGDIPYVLANYWTGNAARFPELQPLNANVLGKLVTNGGVTNFPGWIPGTEILIPASWNPGAKPYPPTLGH